MNFRDERVKITRLVDGRQQKVLECWVSIMEIRATGLDSSEAAVHGEVKVRFKTWMRPAFKDIIQNPAEYRVEFLRGFAPNGQIAGARRDTDRRCVVVDA